jgi:hypothetical protein
VEIKLLIEKKEKTFVPRFISARQFRKGMEISKKVKVGIYEPEELDTVVDYVVELYDHQFTRDEFYDGLPSHQLHPTIMHCIDGIFASANKAMGASEDPNV